MGMEVARNLCDGLSGDGQDGQRRHTHGLEGDCRQLDSLCAVSQRNPRAADSAACRLWLAKAIDNRIY